MTETLPPEPKPKPKRATLRARVEDVAQLTPHVIRVVLGGEGLRDFPVGAFTDHYVKLLLPPPGASYGEPFDVEDVRARLPREQWPRTRSYTVRAWDPEPARLTLDVVVHGDEGVAGPWAQAARPGDEVQLQGPGGAYVPDPNADWHLLVGDASVVPAVSASLARIPAGVPVHVLLEVDGPQEEQPLESPGDLRVTWVHRNGHAASDEESEPLLLALRAMTFPAGALQGFVHGEASAVRAVRRHLLVDRAVPREALSVSGYWKRSRTDEGWRAEKAEWNRLVEQDTA